MQTIYSGNMLAVILCMQRTVFASACRELEAIYGNNGCVIISALQIFLCFHVWLIVGSCHLLIGNRVVTRPKLAVRSFMFRCGIPVNLSTF